MSAPVDITGQTFGRLTAIRVMGRDSGGRIWLFRCSCGNETQTRAARVRIGKARSCGCLQRETAVQTAANARMAKRIPPLAQRFWAKVDKRAPDECWPWKAGVRSKDEGYGAFYYLGAQRPASRMAWVLTHGVISAHVHVCHSCDNPPCCNPSHLFLGSHLDNNADKVSKKRHPIGQRVGTAKLTDAEAREIKRLKPSGRAPQGYRAALAERFGVSRATITDVWSRRWTHLD